MFHSLTDIDLQRGGGQRLFVGGEEPKSAPENASNATLAQYKVGEFAKGFLKKATNPDQILIPKTILKKIQSFAYNHPKVAKGAAIGLCLIAGIFLAFGAITVTTVSHSWLGALAWIAISGTGASSLLLAKAFWSASNRAKEVHNTLNTLTENDEITGDRVVASHAKDKTATIYTVKHNK